MQRAKSNLTDQRRSRTTATTKMVQTTKIHNEPELIAATPHRSAGVDMDEFLPVSVI